MPASSLLAVDSGRAGCVQRPGASHTLIYHAVLVRMQAGCMLGLVWQWLMLIMMS